MVTLSLLALSLSLGGCASTDNADASGVGSGESNVSASASTPVTLENYKTHPSIIAIQRQVEDIEAASFTATEHRGQCGVNTRFDDDTFVIRKLVIARGGNGLDDTVTAYYNHEGKLLYAVRVQHSPQDGDQWSGVEHRVYFSAGVDVFFQVVREGDAAIFHDIPWGPDRLPTRSEAWTNTAGFNNPAALFATTSCAASGGGSTF